LRILSGSATKTDDENTLFLIRLVTYGNYMKELMNSREHISKYQVCISANLSHTVGLKVDGTVVAVGHNEYGQCNTQDWKDIVAISSGGNYSYGSHTVGLKSNGTVVATGYNEYGQCNTQSWRNIGENSERLKKEH